MRWLTLTLAIGICAALGFASGALVQRRHDSALVGSRASGAASFRPGGLGAFGPGGGQQGSGNSPGGNSPGGNAPGGQAAGGTGTGQGGGASSSPPVVVGTVTSIRGSTLKVRNFAGTVVTVHVPAGTPVTTSGLKPLAAGATVSVTGSRGSDGTVTATSLISRQAG